MESRLSRLEMCPGAPISGGSQIQRISRMTEQTPQPVPEEQQAAPNTETATPAAAVTPEALAAAEPPLPKSERPRYSAVRRCIFRHTARAICSSEYTSRSRARDASHTSSSRYWPGEIRGSNIGILGSGFGKFRNSNI